jgi:hypothetical protein
MQKPHGVWAFIMLALAGFFFFFSFLVGLLMLCGFASKAEAFPENIRHGYTSCTSCHVSPVGGGTLTPYGRGVIDSLTTAAVDGAEQPLYGLVGSPPDWLMVGGDQRAVYYTMSPTFAPPSRQLIPMQLDAELALRVMPGIIVDASIGEYGPDHSIEYRRFYVKADLNPNLSLRVGHFLPAYGINLPDHTTIVRDQLGLGEGGETNNVELAFIRPYGESILTFIYGNASTFTVDPKIGVNNKPGDEMSGLAWRGAANVNTHAQVGLSYMGVSSFATWQQSYGVFAQVGITPKSYILAEYDRKFQDGQRFNLGLIKAGYEFYPGLAATLQGEMQDVTRGQSAGIQWWPFPHWEIVLEERRTFLDMSYRTFVDSGVLLLHHYL